MKTTLPWFLTFLIGCSAPTLQEGFYECLAATDCPSGWSCHQDGFCYSEQPLTVPGEDGGEDAGTDAGTDSGEDTRTDSGTDSGDGTDAAQDAGDSGVVVPEPCDTPDAHRCDGLLAQVCTAQVWVTEQTCPYVCGGGQCFGECVPGTTQCNTATYPDSVQTCDAQGAWVQTRSCPNGSACTGEGFCGPVDPQWEVVCLGNLASCVEFKGDSCADDSTCGGGGAWCGSGNCSTTGTPCNRNSECLGSDTCLATCICPANPNYDQNNPLCRN
jgi:hypothetical protein